VLGNCKTSSAAGPASGRCTIPTNCSAINS
jgi:hypothetical protein